MIDPTQIDYEALSRMGQQGLPSALSLVGRVFGLGDDERADLAQGGGKKWLLLGAGLAVAFVAGVQVHKRWPEVLPRVIGGGR